MRWSMLPISVGAHVVAAVLVWIIPLAAEVALPVPAPLRALYVTAKVVPPPADVARPVAQRAVHAPAPVPAPTTAPTEISRERESEPATTGSDPTPGPPTGGFPDTTGGLPDAVGTAPGGGPPSPPPPPRQPLPIGGKIRAPKKIVDVPPVYPEIAKATKVEGLVILEAVISERGNVERVRVLRSHPLLDAAAVEAVKGWRYTPTLLNNVPVSVLITITMNFKLND